jgi:hypothetical protein
MRGWLESSCGAPSHWLPRCKAEGCALTKSSAREGLASRPTARNGGSGSAALALEQPTADHVKFAVRQVNCCQLHEPATDSELDADNPIGSALRKPQFHVTLMRRGEGDSQ